MMAEASGSPPGAAGEAACEEVEDLAALLPIDLQIRRFLDGDTHGRALLQALYGAALDEPVPEALRQLLAK